MAALSFYCVESRKTVEVDVHRVLKTILKNGRPAAVAFDPETGSKMFKVLSMREEALLEGVVPDEAYLIEMNKKASEAAQKQKMTRQRAGAYQQAETIWTDFFDNEDEREAEEKQIQSNFSKTERAINRDADAKNSQIQHQMADAKALYERAMGALTPYLKQPKR